VSALQAQSPEFTTPYCSWVLVPHTINPTTWKGETEGITIQSQGRQVVLKTLISKIARTKWTGCVTQVIEKLLHKFKLESHQETKNKQMKKSKKKKKIQYHKKCDELKLVQRIAPIKKYVSLGFKNIQHYITLISFKLKYTIKE
jgi:hypothetical protein